MRFTFIIRFSLLITSFAVVISTSAGELIHPGGWHTQADLTLIRTKVTAEEKPWIDGWAALKSKRIREDYEGEVTSLMTDRDALSNKGMPPMFSR